MTLQSDLAKLRREQRVLADMQRRVSGQIRDRVRAAHEAGVSWSEIATAAGVTKGRIGQFLKS
ncbi:hypothetical protein CH282_26195 [Rhodococcus sp. 06-418-1B]|nr:hypothetical protein [Rhodococcus sp. 06-418-1B]OZC76371.1 hypothetical protein CH282_26195 [Rhodococcus sp. 06-418-1B]